MKTNPLIITKKMGLVFSSILVFSFAGCSSGDQIIPSDYTNRQSGFGAEVIVETQEGYEYTGELLSVRDSIIFVCNNYGVSETDLAKGIYPIHHISTNRITLIAVKGKKTYITGMLVGGAAGAAMGALIGSAAGSDTKKTGFSIFSEPTKSQCIAGGACLFGLTGLVVGGLIGAASSSEDKIIYHSVLPSRIDYDFLKRFARYINGEPDYIRAFRNNNSE